MEVPELPCPASPAREQPAPASGPPGPPGGQASPRLALGHVILPPEQGLAPTVFLKALPIPLYHTVPPGGLQPRAPLVAGSLEGGTVPFILSPLLPPEAPGAAQAGKPGTPGVTVNVAGPLPVLSPGLGPTLGSPGKVRSASKYLCPHCGRDCLKPSVLEKHIRSHTGERPFPCATCGIAFKTQSNLYKHRRTQTHLSHARLSSGPGGAAGGPPEDGGQAGEPSAAPGRAGSGTLAEGARSGSPTHLSPVARSLDLKLEATSCPGSTSGEREASPDSAPTAPAGPPGAPPRGKLPAEQRSPTAGRVCPPQQQQQQQQPPPGTASEKPGDPRASEGRLRKCESTDSGYLSRSDSVEQPLAPCSPLHSLSEHSAESAGGGPPGPGGGSGAEPGGQAPSLELEKRRLEERIARLISHNQAVVDDPQLDHVRPRKTGLCKQGSIDLPLPYTYKDSFHFEIRAPSPARAAGAAPDKARPLFFHSVPTQLSATVECVPVTRSHSLPLVEATRMWQEPSDPRAACPRRQKPLSPRPTAGRLVNVPSAHPRGLVRQAAVEDPPCAPGADPAAPAEERDARRAAAGEGAAGRGTAAGRRGGPRKLKLFCQEKWQVYGDEAFQRFYQRAGAGPRGCRKPREAGRAAALGLPLQGEAAGGEGTALSQDQATPVGGGTSVGARLGTWGGPPATESFLMTEPPKQRETVASVGSSEQPREGRASSPATPGGSEPPRLGSRSPVLPPRRRPELGCQLPPAPGPFKGGDPEAPRLLLPDPGLEGDRWGGGDVKEPWQQALTGPGQPGSSPGEPQPARDRLPSERKKLRVEASGCPERPGPLGAGGQTPGGSVQATSLQSWGPGDKPRGLHRRADCAPKDRARPPEASGASSPLSSVVLQPAGPRDKEPILGPTAGAPGGQSQLDLQPRGPVTDPAFPPKYLLRLPQGETVPPLPAAQDPLCRSGPEDPAASVGSGLGTLLPSCPAAGLAPDGADSPGEDARWSGLWGRRKEALGEEKGRSGTSAPAAGGALGLSTEAPRELHSVLPVLTGDPRRSETLNTGPLPVGSTWASSGPPGAVPGPWALSGNVEGPPPGPLAGHSPRCSLRPGPVLAGLPPLGAYSEHPGSRGAQGPFPSLRAGPRLTWCCLSRSLPLPAEQKEKTASVYWALHCPGGSPPDEGVDTQPPSKAVSGRRSRTSPAGGGGVQPWKLSCPAAAGMPSRDPGSELERKKGLPRRRAKVARGSSKQKKLRRCGGSFLQARAQLRAGRLRKPLCVPRKDCPPPAPEGLDPRRTLRQASSGAAGPRPHGAPSPATSASSLGCGSGEKEGDRRPAPGSSRCGRTPGTVRERDAFSAEALPAAACGCGDCWPGPSLPPGSRGQLAHSLPSGGRGPDTGPPGTQRLPAQEQASAAPEPCAASGAPEPSPFESGGRPDAATSVAATCTSPGARGGGHTALGTHAAEPRGRGRAAGEPPTQGPPDRRAAAQATSLPGPPAPGQRLSGSAPARSPGKTHPETPASGASSAGSRQEEGPPKTPFLSGGQRGCGETRVCCPPSGEDGEKRQEAGPVALRDGVVPSKPGPPTEVPDALCKTGKKRGLEGMRKQTRVELSDTSSDDEDRLVIEI